MFIQIQSESRCLEGKGGRPKHGREQLLDQWQRCLSVATPLLPYIEAKGKAKTHPYGRSSWQRGQSSLCWHRRAPLHRLFKNTHYQYC